MDGSSSSSRPKPIERNAGPSLDSCPDWKCRMVETLPAKTAKNQHGKPCRNGMLLPRNRTYAQQMHFREEQILHDKTILEAIGRDIIVLLKRLVRAFVCVVITNLYGIKHDHGMSKRLMLKILY